MVPAVGGGGGVVVARGGPQKSHRYVSASFSGSVAVASNFTFNGAWPSAGVAVAVTSGGAETAAPLPCTWNQLMFISPPSGPVNTRYSVCVPVGAPVIGVETVVQFCQPPVGLTFTEANVAAVGESALSSIFPPAPALATRKSIELMSLKDTRLK